MEENKKDAWDRITALASILIPAAIALAGYFVSQGLKQAEISSEEHRADQSRQIAEANTKIAQANLINTMMKSLTSNNPQERMLASRAVMIAMPDAGVELVRTVAVSDGDKVVQEAARSSLQERVDGLIRDLFSDVRPARISAAQELVQGWRTQPDAVQALVDYAMQNSKNADGIYNAVVVLQEFDPRALVAKKSILGPFIQLAKGAGPRTAARADALEARIAQ